MIVPRIFAALLCAGFIAPALSASEPVRPPALQWERTVVTLDVKRKKYDYFQPWVTPMQNLQKSGVVLGNREILTTAEGLSDLTLLRLQREGRGRWFVGEVMWIDHHANLALVTTEESAFWEGLQPAELSKPVQVGNLLQVVRWRAGKLETRRAEFSQFSVEDSKLSYIQHLHLDVTSEITGAGSAEPLISGRNLLGLVSNQTGNNCRVIPSSFIHSILQARKDGKFGGLGFFDFYWQKSENPATLEALGWKDESSGVIVIEVPNSPGKENPLKPRDIILKVDGFEIDNTGDYRDPDYGHLSLENLATRNKWAGDNVQLTIWRNGGKMELEYPIAKANFASQLVPHGVFDQEPEYLMVGGLIFQPLTGAFLQGWGADWKRRAPFRLTYYAKEPPTADRPSLVILSQVLPDPVNLGYQEYRFLILDRVNGQAISRLSELKQALQQSGDGFHTFEFMKGDTLRKMVINAAEAEQATKRVLQLYGIEKEYVSATSSSVVRN
jgi:hypothetical protein